MKTPTCRINTERKLIVTIRSSVFLREKTLTDLSNLPPTAEWHTSTGCAGNPRIVIYQFDSVIFSQLTPWLLLSRSSESACLLASRCQGCYEEGKSPPVMVKLGFPRWFVAIISLQFHNCVSEQLPVQTRETIAFFECNDAFVLYCKLIQSFFTQRPHNRSLILP